MMYGRPERGRQCLSEKSRIGHHSQSSKCLLLALNRICRTRHCPRPTVSRLTGSSSGFSDPRHPKKVRLRTKFKSNSEDFYPQLERFVNACARRRDTMAINAHQRRAGPSSTTSSRKIALLSRPKPNLPAHGFRIGAEVFLLDSKTGKNILYKSAGCDDILNPHCINSANTFLVRRCWIKLPNQSVLTPVGANFKAAGARINGQCVYQITPKRSTGKDMLVAAKRLVAVRFKPGDWVWFLPLVRVGADEKRANKEKALVIGAQVIRGKRVYHVHVPAKSEDRLLVPEERLEGSCARSETDGQIVSTHARVAAHFVNDCLVDGRHT